MFPYPRSKPAFLIPVAAGERLMGGCIMSKSRDSSCWAWYRSHRNWRFIQNPAETPKNFAKRNAVLGVIPCAL